jgi:hypothetical protein
MKLMDLFAAQPPFVAFRNELRNAITKGKITEHTDSSSAISLLFDSLDLVELTMALEENGHESEDTARNVKELLWLMECWDRDWELKRKNQRLQ